ncbi:MAG: plasmid pRiA4b ORF-3 family protein, partial [Anaerolineae bacterium]|nr:plasmid pRiA4b ORF-3 family protein [Anaerolineae bacterium]
EGKRACPPENVGGIRSYERFLHALRDPNNPGYEIHTWWLSEEFDPEAFDLPGVNKIMRESW